MVFAGGAGESSGQTTLTVLDAFVPSEGVTYAWRDSLGKFEEAHPDVVIDEETISNADLTIKVQTLGALLLKDRWQRISLKMASLCLSMNILRCILNGQQISRKVFFQLHV